MNKLYDEVKYAYDKIKFAIPRFEAEHELEKMFVIQYLNKWKAYPELKVIKK